MDPIKRRPSQDCPVPYEVPVSNHQGGAYDDIVKRNLMSQPEHDTLPHTYDDIKSKIPSNTPKEEMVKPGAAQIYLASAGEQNQQGLVEHQGPPVTSPTARGPEYTYIRDYDFFTAGEKQSRESNQGLPVTSPTARGPEYTYMDDYDFSAAGGKQNRKSHPDMRNNPNVRINERKILSTSVHDFTSALRLDEGNPTMVSSRPRSLSTQSIPQLQERKDTHFLVEPYNMQCGEPLVRDHGVAVKDMTKEQLLAYIEAMQSAQTAPSVRHHMPEQENYPAATECGHTPPKRSDVYVNLMGCNRLPEEEPPPLPPKPKSRTMWSLSHQDIGELQPKGNALGRNPTKSTSVSKSQSLLLQGSSAEAIRQRYRYQSRVPREEFRDVRFNLVEEDEDELFTQDTIRHAASSELVSEKCPPVPPRLHKKSEERSYQNFTPTVQKPNLPKRSHTMKAYLPSDFEHRRRYNRAYPDDEDRYWSKCEHRPALSKVQGQHHLKQSNNLDIEEVRTLLGMNKSVIQQSRLGRYE